MKIVINGTLPSLNELIAKINYNRHAGNKLKQEITEYCESVFREQCSESYEKPIYITFVWYEKNKKRDKDNIASAKKYILDGMQRAGVIKNDNWKGIEGWEDRFYIDKDNPRIEVNIVEL